MAGPRMRALATAVCVALCGAGIAVAGTGVSAPPSASAPAVAPDAGLRVADRLPAGLSRSEHAALERAGAYGGNPLRLLVVGDSIALTLGIGLAQGSQQAYGVTVSDHATLGCDLDPGTEVRTLGKLGPATGGCDDWRAQWSALAASTRPQVVAIGVGRWEVLDHYWDGQWVHIGEPVWDDHVTADLQDAIGIFQSFGARVVLLTMPFVDPTDHQPDGLPWSEDSPARTNAYNGVVERVAAGLSGVSVVNVNHMLSPQGVYTASLAGVAVRWQDGIHVTVAGGELLQPKILPEVAAVGLQEERGGRVHA